MQWLFHPARGRNWLHFILRWFILVGFSIVIVVARLAAMPLPRRLEFEQIQDVLAAAGIGALVTVILGVFSSIKVLRPFAVYVKLPGDWIIAGVFVYLTHGDLALTTGIVVIMVVAGVLRLGISEGMIQAIGVMVAAGIALATMPELGMTWMRQNTILFVPPGLFVALLLVIAGAWAYVLDEANSPNWKNLKNDLDSKNQRLTNMQESAKSFSEMAASLNSSLEYDKILSTALNIGRLSLRHDPKKRTVAIALMVDDDEKLEVAASQGMTHQDMTRHFAGKEGIVGRVMEVGEVEIRQADANPDMDDADIASLAGVGELDPELKLMVTFRGIHSLLCVPLRADYTTYGVLLFGSSEPNAFNADNIEILKSVGVQVTVALKNSVLYATLEEEKKRLIELERNARQALVRDLHDTVTQTVSAVKMRLSTIPMLAERYPDRLRPEVDELSDMTSRAVEEMRHVMFTLRPLVLENQGLGAAVDELKARFERTHKQRMETQLEYRVESYLSLDQQEMLFYLVEEAANNARKYAQAEKITVKISHENEDCIVRIMDNGKGFDAAKMKRGKGGSFGMVNMQDRAALIGGSIEIDSAIGKGTRITVRVPLGVRAEPQTNGVVVTPNRETQTRQAIKRERSGPLSPMS